MKRSGPDEWDSDSRCIKIASSSSVTRRELVAKCRLSRAPRGFSKRKRSGWGVGQIQGSESSPGQPSTNWLRSKQVDEQMGLGLHYLLG